MFCTTEISFSASERTWQYRDECTSICYMLASPGFWYRHGNCYQYQVRKMLFPEPHHTVWTIPAQHMYPWQPQMSPGTWHIPGCQLCVPWKDRPLHASKVQCTGSSLSGAKQLQWDWGSWSQLEEQLSVKWLGLLQGELQWRSWVTAEQHHWLCKDVAQCSHVPERAGCSHPSYKVSHWHCGEEKLCSLLSMTSYSSFNLSDTLQQCELGEVYTAVEGLWMPDKVSGGEPGPQLISCTCSDKLTPCWHALQWFLQRGRVAQIHASSQICSTTASTGTLTIEAQTVVISPLAGALWLPAQSKHRNHSGPGKDAGRQPGRHSIFWTSSYAIHSERSSARGTHTLLKQESEPILLRHICLEPFSLQCRGWPVYSIGSTPAFAPPRRG